MKKTIFVTLFLILILIANVTFASYSTVTMEVVEEPICTIQIGDNSKFEKKLISKDLQNKEVTLQLQITNEEIANKPTGEIVLVIDNSNSMQDLANSTQKRGDLIRASSKTLVNQLLQDNASLKVGAVSFSSSNQKNSEGYTTLGTENDSTLLTNLTSDISTLETAIDNITYAAETEASYTNLQAGLNRGKQLFSNEDNNKYLIVLTDGVPNVILNRNSVLYDNDTISATKSEYQSIATSGINVITMLTGIQNGEADINDTMTYNEYVNSIFGTPETPTVGKFYYITDDKIEETITNDIYNALIPQSGSYKNITIVDYFPAEIVNNFDFAYVSNANIGNISASIDKSNNSITWTIPELAIGQTATVQYKLKLKQDFDSSIVGKILNTNEKVDITYTDFNDEEQDKTSDITPKLKLSEPPAVLPKAGLKTMLITFGTTAFVVLGYSLTRLIMVNKKMKN